MSVNAADKIENRNRNYELKVNESYTEKEGKEVEEEEETLLS